MVKVSTLAIAGGSVLLAAGAGIYMQMSGAGSDARSVAALTSVPDVTVQATVSDSVEAETPAQTPLDIDAITLTSLDVAVDAAPKLAVTDRDLIDVIIYAPDEPMAPLLASIDQDDLMNDAAPETAPAATAPISKDLGTGATETAMDCTVDLTGESRAAAMVALTLAAPCHPDSLVSFTHEGMKFSAMTDADGALSVTVPALSASATFLAMLDDGNGAAVEMEVDSLAFYDRSVVQWQGDAGVELHAFEYGAGWDEDGHVWSGAPREAVVAARGEGGFLTRLGDATIDGARIAEVYTFPTGTAKTGGDVALSVEIEVTEANCGQALRADVIEVTDARASTPGELSLTVPACDAVGDFIQLKNLVRDLKIAAR